MRDYKQTVRELRDPHFVYHFSRDYLKNMMDDAADAIEELYELVNSNKTAVKHGQWECEIRNTIDGLHTYQQFRCSVCGMTYITNTPYCPHCGAKMDAEEGEKA